jgi:hypothetical protein
MIVQKEFFVSYPELVHNPEMWYADEEECRKANPESISITRLLVQVQVNPLPVLDVERLSEAERGIAWIKQNPSGKHSLIETIKAMRAECGSPTLSLKTCKQLVDLFFQFGA